MRRYLKEYIKTIEETKKIKDFEMKISFFQHERLIHLIVTLFFVLFSIIFTYICFNTEILEIFVITLVLYVIDIFYIIHYFFLENGIQKLYKLYDKYNRK